jgi:hypothetical protein
VLATATQYQFDACCSLCYNIGEDAFSKSTLAIKHNAGDYPGAAAQFARWNKSKGAVHPGLVLRRERERSVYEGFTAGAPWSGGSTSGPSGGGFTSIANPISAVGNPPPLRTTSTGGALLVVGAVFFCSA